MKTHVFLKFEYKDTNWKVLTSTVSFPKVIRDARFIELVDFSPSAVLFAFTCDLVTDSYSNCIDNLLSISLGGIGSKDRYKATVSGNIREITVNMSYPIPRVIYHERQKYSRAHLVIYSGVNDISINDLPLMKSTTFLLKAVSDPSKKRQSVTYTLPKPLFNAKYIQVINWFASGGYDYVTCPIVRKQDTNDSNLSEPVLAYGVAGVSKNTQVMEIENPGTLNQLQISLQRQDNTKYLLNHSFIHLIVFHD